MGIFFIIIFFFVFCLVLYGNANVDSVAYVPAA